MFFCRLRFLLTFSIMGSDLDFNRMYAILCILFIDFTKCLSFRKIVLQNTRK